MANIKKLETVVKAVETASVDELKGIIKNENVEVENLNKRETFSVLVFNELAKALNKKGAYELVMDCNYPASGKHTHKDPADDEWLVDYYRLINAVDGKSMIQFYVLADEKHGKCKFNLCTSCARLNREQFEIMEDDLHFTIARDKSGRPKTSFRRGVSYEDIPEVVNAVLAVLSASALQAQKAKEEKVAEKQKKADEKADKKEERKSSKKSTAKKEKAVA